MTETSAGKIKKEEHIFKSTSGVCDIHTVIWYPDKEKYENPLGVVQIAHGMIDHIERFEGLALYLTERGFVVAGNDHLGHGDSVNDKNDWGYFAKGNNSRLYLVKDMHKLTIIMKNLFLHTLIRVMLIIRLYMVMPMQLIMLLRNIRSQ